MLIDQRQDADGAGIGGITVEKAWSDPQWEAIRTLVDEVYVREKSWMVSPRLEEFSDGSPGSVFLLKNRGATAGLFRMRCSPGRCPDPGHEADFRAWRDRKQAGTVQVQVAEWGRLIMRKGVRPRPRHLMALSVAVLRECEALGCTHILADTIEDEPQPRRFLTRVLGFEPIGTRHSSEVSLSADLNLITVASDVEHVLMKARRVPWAGRHCAGRRAVRSHPHPPRRWVGQEREKAWDLGGFRA